MASGNPSSMIATTERPLADVDCLDNHPGMEVRDPTKEISEQMATHHLSPPPPPLVKGGGRLSKEIWEIIKERNPKGAKDLRKLSELNSRQYKLEHGMSSANPSPMMATTKRPLIYVDCFGNHKQFTGAYDLGFSPPPQKKGSSRLDEELWEIIKERNPQRAKDLRELAALNSRQSKLEHGMSSGNPSPMMATTKRPLVYADCFDNHSRREISEQMTGYHFYGSPPPQKKGRSRLDEEIWEILKHENPQAKNLDELCEFSRRQSQLEHDRLMPIWKAYQKEVDESDGFDVSDYGSTMFPPLPGMIVPYTCSKDELADRLNVDAKSAIELYNKKMANCAAILTDLITFTASEENDEPKVFQARVFRPVQCYPVVTLCRQKGDRLGGYRRTDMYR